MATGWLPFGERERKMEIPKNKRDCKKIHCPNCAYYLTTDCAILPERMNKETGIKEVENEVTMFSM